MLLNFDIKSAKEMRHIQLNELDEIWLNSFENSKIYKHKTKAFPNKNIFKSEFNVSDLGNVVQLSVKIIHQELSHFQNQQYLWFRFLWELFRLRASG